MTPAHPAIDTETAARLRGVIARLSRQFNQSATLEGLTPSQASALGLISVRGALTLVEVTRIEGLNPTMVSRIVARLDELGLIRRSAHPADQRAGVVEPTALGLEVSARLRDQRAAVVAASLEQLAPDARDLVIAALPALEQLEASLAQRG